MLFKRRVTNSMLELLYGCYVTGEAACHRCARNNGSKVRMIDKMSSMGLLETARPNFINLEGAKLVQRMFEVDEPAPRKNS